MAQDGMTIVIVEDDDGHAELVRRHLRRAGIENPLEHIDRGSDALDYVLRRGRFAARPAQMALVVLLDINMPGGVDGLEVLRQIRAHPSTEHLPVVILSTADDPREIARCHELGCNAFVNKPIDPIHFGEVIRELGLLLSVATLPPERKVE